MVEYNSSAISRFGNDRMRSWRQDERTVCDTSRRDGVPTQSRGDNSRGVSEVLRRTTTCTCSAGSWHALKVVEQPIVGTRAFRDCCQSEMAEKHNRFLLENSDSIDVVFGTHLDSHGLTVMDYNAAYAALAKHLGLSRSFVKKVKHHQNSNCRTIGSYANQPELRVFPSLHDLLAERLAELAPH